MSTLVKSAALGLGLVIGVACAAHAQSENLAALPPGAAATPAAPAAPMGPALGDVARPAGVSPQYVGPDPGRGFYPSEKQTRVVEPSAPYVGPDPGRGFYPSEKHTQEVQPSAEYPGPALSSGNGSDE